LNDGEFGKIATELRAGTGSVFEKDGEARILFVCIVNRAPSKGHGFGNIEHALFPCEAILVIAGMDD